MESFEIHQTSESEEGNLLDTTLMEEDNLLDTLTMEDGNLEDTPMEEIIIRPLANVHPEDPSSCKRSSRGSSFLQIIIRLLVNNHLEDPASCK